MQRGCSLEDYDIRLGDAVCVPVSLSDNQVDCRPPANRPNKNVNNKLCRGDMLSLQASETYCNCLGRRNFNVLRCSYVS